MRSKLEGRPPSGILVEDDEEQSVLINRQNLSDCLYTVSVMRYVNSITPLSTT